jgi:hypothetical protein
MVRQKDNDRDPLDRRYEEGDAMARAWIEYRPFKRWLVYIVAGADDLIDNPGPWVGLRAELLDNDLRNLTAVSGFSQ